MVVPRRSMIEEHTLDAASEPYTGHVVGTDEFSQVVVTSAAAHRAL